MQMSEPITITQSDFSSLLDKALSAKNGPGYLSNFQSFVESRGLGKHVVLYDKKIVFSNFEIKEPIEVSFHTFSEIVFSNVQFTNLESKIDASNNTEKLLLKECVFNGDLNVLSSEVELHSCKINNLRVFNSFTTYLSIFDTKVVTLDLQLSNLLSLQSVRSSFEDILLGDSKKLTSIVSLIFDNKSSITGSKALVRYKELDYIARSTNDKIQSHIFYVKQLGVYTNQKYLEKEAMVQIAINSFLNKNGLSLVRPILLMFLVNFLSVLFIYKYELLHNHELSCTYFWNSLNVLLTQSIVDDEFSIAAHAIDGLRRVALGIGIYSAISAALRFRYKFD